MRTVRLELEQRDEERAEAVNNDELGPCAFVRQVLAEPRQRVEQGVYVGHRDGTHTRDGVRQLQAMSMRGETRRADLLDADRVVGVCLRDPQQPLGRHVRAVRDPEDLGAVERAEVRSDCEAELRLACARVASQLRQLPGAQAAAQQLVEPAARERDATRSCANAAQPAGRVRRALWSPQAHRC